jgi:hypothetical protein
VRFYDIELWNFWEDSMLFDTEVKVSCLIESATRDTTEITNTRKDDSDKLLEKVKHTISTKRHHHTDWHTSTKFKIRDSYTSMVNTRELTSDKSEIILKTREILMS